MLIEVVAVLKESAMHSLAMHQLNSLIDQERHQAPEVPFTVGDAHRVMQFHVACRVRRCPRKAAALTVLVEAGRVVPSTSQPR